MTVDDPFAHLHDEGYAERFSSPTIDASAMIATGGRQRVSLDGEWRFTPDLFDEGLRQEWFSVKPVPLANWRVPRDYDEAGAKMMQVPSCWTMAQPEFRYFEGAAWYARTFTWPALLHGERLVLRIGAANYAARVFLNGTLLGFHRGGSTPFFVELTGTLVAGENRLLVQVENRRSSDRVPMHHFDWFNHGGIYREVDLLPLSKNFIRDVFIRLLPDSGFSRIAIDIELSDDVLPEAHVRIDELGIDTAVVVSGRMGSLVVEAKPVLWSPDSPRLYEVEIRCGSDRLIERVGFRDIRAVGTEILLNGEPLYLRGVCVHEDDFALGKMTNDADIRRRLTHARELGCNFLRLAHYPHHERVAEIADEVGLMLWAEIPVYWAIAFDNPATLADARNQLLELIRRDRNRASVVIWGVGNENADTDERYVFMSTLAEVAREADSSRLVSAACLINRTGFQIEDRLAAHLDVIGLNEYFGWYEPDLSGLERLLANSKPDRPVVISETGADALAGYLGDPQELFTEECQANFYDRQFEILARADYVRGICPWLLYDFRSERRQTRFQRGFNRKGLIAEDKSTKKLAFSVIAAHYRSLTAGERDGRRTGAPPR